MDGNERARVLVVDDDPAVREALVSSLRSEGYEVAEAGDGVAALRQVEREKPDLVVLDVLMPRMDGLTACRRLRARGEWLPVLMLTARDMVGDRVTGRGGRSTSPAPSTCCWRCSCSIRGRC